jgi:Helix-turn-helix domain.
MILGFKTELHPTNQQKTLLAKHAGVARHAYNWGLWLTRNILTHNSNNPDSKQDLRKDTNYSVNIGSGLSKIHHI